MIRRPPRSTRTDTLFPYTTLFRSNALAETINGLYKAELIHRRAPWKSKAAVELATLEWVAWFNNHRLLEPIGYIPPAEAEANYYQQLTAQAMTLARSEEHTSELQSLMRISYAVFCLKKKTQYQQKTNTHN